MLELVGEGGTDQINFFQRGFLLFVREIGFNDIGTQPRGMLCEFCESRASFIGFRWL